ncbi:spore gernimation protein GerA [Bacillus sp. SA1-12]|uniref:spore germination protein n=1 Tax=Bacillus sp. SA1-12 TaxID=1455638 RepID=UPI0006261801|nr:spore germination protein [Bacillus sp. SA1-12]KKI93070.1 spore gernimation protein GerA [Bacillus sp. SA1-12]
MVENNVEYTVEGMQNLFYSSSDVVIKTILIGEGEKILVVFCQPLVDTNIVNQFVLLPMNQHESVEKLLESLKNSIQISAVEKAQITPDDICSFIFSGKLMVTTWENDVVYFYDISKIPSRTPDESITEVSVRGPKDGFVEEIGTNIGLVRKRLKTASFIVEEYKVGKRTQTKVALLYITDIINSELLKEIKERLENIEIDILTGSAQMEQHIAKKQLLSLFPLVDYTGRPDYVVESINQGRFSIIVDGAPTALVAPANLGYLIKTSEDGHTSFFYASVERLLRLFGLIVTIFLPGLYTALTTHNVGQLPLPLLATISLSRMGLPFTAFIEIIIMLIMFELFREAGARLPKAVGQTVAVLGGLIIGDAAIRGGITSPTMLVVIGVTAIASFTLVNQSLAGNIFILRLYVVILSYVMGIFGVIIGFISIVMYLANLKSFGFPYLSLYTNLTWKDFLSIFIKLPEEIKDKRGAGLKQKDSSRLGETE